jgi:hypothetical protein
VVASLYTAFAGLARPEHFTNHTHCDECLEHDDFLRSRDRDGLSHDDLPSAAWDPITMTTPTAFAYLLPGLARLALAPPHDQWGWYGERLVFQLRWDGRLNVRWQACTPAQRRAVAGFLEHLLATRTDLVAEYDYSEELSDALSIWSEADDG